jgi:hypothetical protein
MEDFDPLVLGRKANMAQDNVKDVSCVALDQQIPSDSDGMETRSVDPVEVRQVAEAQLRFLRRFARLVAQALRADIVPGENASPP